MGVVYLLLLTNAILLTSCVFGSCTVLTDMGVTLSTMNSLTIGPEVCHHAKQEQSVLLS